jgi:protein-tyrosine phosphatase
MRVTTYRIKRTGSGHLSVMARPRGGDWLDDEMSSLREQGQTVVVSMLVPAEAHELDLANEETAARAAGLQFRALPVPDRGLPDAKAFREVVREVERDLEAGESVVIHCRMGIGRASMLAVGVLRAEGLSSDEAWKRVESARGIRVPDTETQRSWVNGLDLKTDS